MFCTPSLYDAEEEINALLFFNEPHKHAAVVGYSRNLCDELCHSYKFTPQPQATQGQRVPMLSRSELADL